MIFFDIQIIRLIISPIKPEPNITSIGFGLYLKNTKSEKINIRINSIELAIEALRLPTNNERAVVASKAITIDLKPNKALAKTWF